MLDFFNGIKPLWKSVHIPSNLHIYVLPLSNITFHIIFLLIHILQLLEYIKIKEM